LKDPGFETFFLACRLWVVVSVRPMKAGAHIRVQHQDFGQSNFEFLSPPDRVQWQFQESVLIKC